jgi:uncharacterized protein DUF6883
VKLPAAERAVMDSRKIREYLLSPSHPVGRFKAAYFARLGYTLESWQDFASSLHAAVMRDEVDSIETTPYGRKFRVRSILEGQGGTRAGVISVWIIRQGEEVPHLVTVMPER